MEREQELAIIRRAYAKQVLAEWQVDDPRLELAFTQVRREDFLGPGTVGDPPMDWGVAWSPCCRIRTHA